MGASSEQKSTSPYSWPSFEDGNIILQAGNTKFRVHRGVLSAHSPVFRDTFALGQPAEGGAASDSEHCPVVVLQDSAEDLKYLLGTLYSPLSVASFSSTYALIDTDPSQPL
jgi:hypothetical protein